MQYNRDRGLDYTVMDVPYDEFVHKELIHFSNRDLERSINHLCDGLKESTRKILFACFKRGLFKDEMKVAQLAAYVASVSEYKHGEVSLQEAIVGMAQMFVGANNINLLEQHGQFGCLDPSTKIVMWDGSVKEAQHVKVGDQLIGDDGNVRDVLKTTSGLDTMYRIRMSNGEELIVNSQHILTLQHSTSGKIYWKESSKSWRTEFWDYKTGSLKHKSVSTKDKTEGSHFNASRLTKEEAYDVIHAFVEDNGLHNQIIDIKVEDFLKLPKSVHHHLYCIKNTSSIAWESKPTPIDPYVFGCWLGDGNACGTGITSMDIEILQTFAKYADTIGCELTHDPNGKTRDGSVKENYHFTIRKRNAVHRITKTSIGDALHSSATCIGCQTSVKQQPICDWKYEKIPLSHNNYHGVASNGMNRTDMNPWKMLLKKNGLFNNKHVPVEYIVNDKMTRLQVLAGIIDTDGCVKYNNGIPIIEITQCKRLHHNIITSIQMIANSLGFQTSVKSYSKGLTKRGECKEQVSLLIFGDHLDTIPTKLPRKKVVYGKARARNAHTLSFEVEDIGDGPFCGWQVNGNERFLLGDFTITHNSRIQGGSDHASCRYIFTLLTKLAKAVFKEADNGVLKFIEDEGTMVEPEFYIPIIPMILVNGGIGIGTGFSTNVPCHNPDDIITICETISTRLEEEIGAIEDANGVERAKQVIADMELTEIAPWYLGFRGAITSHKSGTFQSRGIYTWTDNTTVDITELPIGTWTDDYKEMLLEMVTKGSPHLKDFDSYYTAKNVRFVLKMYPGAKDALGDKFEEEFKLVSTKNLSLNNIHLHGDHGAIKKYANTHEVIKAWAGVRVAKYVERKRYQLADLEEKYSYVSNKVRFIKEIIAGIVIVNNRSLEDLEAQLASRDYKKEATDNYGYLTRLPIHQLTTTKMAQLEAEAAKLFNEIEALRNKRIQSIWKEELAELRTVWHEHKQAVEDEYSADRDNKPAADKGKKRSGGGPAPKVPVARRSNTVGVAKTEK